MVQRPTTRNGFDLLYDIAQLMLSAERDLEERLRGVLHLLSDYGMERGMITLVDGDRREVQVEVSAGLSSSQEGRGRYRRGEGVIGRVLESNAPVVVPRIGDEPSFQDRTGSRQDLDWSNTAFICVPVGSSGDVIGTLSVDRACHDDACEAEKLQEDLRLLTVVSAIIFKAVETYREHREEIESLRRENERLARLHGGSRQPPFIVGNSHAMQQVCHLIEQVAPFDTTVLVRGECGTGKELVARALHLASSRADGPFISVNCAALPEQLVASELFGHVRGAYTGADRSRKGRFEMAHGGTIFLDEIGEIAPAIQVRLLRVLQEGELDRLGDERTIRVDARVIAATNANLEDLIEAGMLRRDLYYRLNVFPIYVPPLRERRSDITLLVDHFLEKYTRHSGRSVVRISTPAIDLLTAYHWPGNVRELENCVARAVLLAHDGVVRSCHLPPSLQTGESSGTTEPGSLEAMMMAYEREILIEAIKNAGGNQAQAARALSTTPRILSYRLRKHGLRSEFVKKGT